MEAKVNALKSEVSTLKQTLAEICVQAVQDHEWLVSLITPSCAGS